MNGETVPTCLHCTIRNSYYYGLCWRCYKDREVRYKYLKKSVGKRGNCAHCKRDCCLQPRGLCGGCYRDLTIRLQYEKVSSASTSNTSGIVVGDSSILPAAPTAAQPGSEEKIKILCERAEAGISLHHPRDRKVRRSCEDDGFTQLLDPDPAELE